MWSTNSPPGARSISTSATKTATPTTSTATTRARDRTSPRTSASAPVAPLAAAAYGTLEWPLHILGLSHAEPSAKNPLLIQLRVNDNRKPVLYVERGEITTATINNRFVDESGPAAVPAAPRPCRPSPIPSPSARPIPAPAPRPASPGSSSLHYGRQIDPATPFPPTVVPTVKTLDNLFGPLGLAPLWSGGQAVRWIAAQDRKFVDGQAAGYGQMMERGVAFEGMPGAGRVIFFAALTDQLRNVIPGFQPLRGITGGTTTAGSFLQAAKYLDQYRLDFGSITDGAAKVTVLSLPPRRVLRRRTLASGVLFLGLAASRAAPAWKLSPASPTGYPRTIFFEELPGTLHRLPQVPAGRPGPRRRTAPPAR